MLGIGHATLTAVNGAVPLEVADVPGVVIAGVTIDAGPKRVAGAAAGRQARQRPRRQGGRANPTTLTDVYFRVGGPHIGKADTALEVNSDNVLIDHIWVWRADHGVEGFTGATPSAGTPTPAATASSSTATTSPRPACSSSTSSSTTPSGTARDGTTILYQNELPYDPPTQADWMNGSVEG